MLFLRLVPLLACLASSTLLPAQQPDTPAPYSRKNTFGLFAEYSNNSSHILLGSAQNRKLLNFGVSYSRRVLLSRSVDLQYLAEFRPVALESDPLTHIVSTYTGPPQNQTYSESFATSRHCVPITLTFAGLLPGGPYQGSPYTSTQTLTCGARQWTIGQAFSPVGLKLNLLPHRRLQPVLTILGGELYTTQPIPISNAGSFNYTLEIGAGFELYRSREPSTSLFGNRSLRAEFRYHHILNADTAQANPGIDNGLFHLTYAFGR